jgi:hypothetical protein
MCTTEPEAVFLCKQPSLTGHLDLQVLALERIPTRNFILEYTGGWRGSCCTVSSQMTLQMHRCPLCVLQTCSGCIAAKSTSLIFTNCHRD